MLWLISEPVKIDLEITKSESNCGEMKKVVTWISMIGAMLGLSQASEASSTAAPDPKAKISISSLEKEDAEFLQNRRGFAAQIEKMRQIPPKDVPITISVLQGMYDGGIAEQIDDQPYWEALAICIGDELVKRHHFEWVLITDEWGTEPAVAVPGKMVYATPMSMIFKRVEKREKVEVEFLIEETARVLNRQAQLSDTEVRN